MKPGERDEIIEQLARTVDRRAATKRRVQQIVAECESLFVVNPAGEPVLSTLEEMFCVQPKPEKLMRLSGGEAKALMARWQGASDVVRFLRRAARGALRIHEAA